MELFLRPRRVVASTNEPKPTELQEKDPSDDLRATHDQHGAINGQRNGKTVDGLANASEISLKDLTRP